MELGFFFFFTNNDYKQISLPGCSYLRPRLKLSNEKEENILIQTQTEKPYNDFTESYCLLSLKNTTFSFNSLHFFH